MKHGWRSPASFHRTKTSSRSSRLTWMQFVDDDHLAWLLSWIPSNVMSLKYESEDSQKYLMDAEDIGCYNNIRDQAETLMARPDAKHWTAEARSNRRQEALHGKLAVEERS